MKLKVSSFTNYKYMIGKMFQNGSRDPDQRPRLFVVPYHRKLGLDTSKDDSSVSRFRDITEGDKI